MAAEKEAKECSICASVKKTVFACPYCNYESCLACNERVILNSMSAPSCVSCKKEFSSDFFHSAFSKAFRDTRYRAHREQILYEREKSLLPATQPAAERAKDAIKLHAEVERARRMLNEARMNVRQAKVAYERASHTLRRHEMGVGEQVAAAARQDGDGDEKMDDSGQGKEVYVSACPVNDCRGFLNQKLVCGMCGVKACRDCREVKQDDQPHTCNPDTVATVQELAKSTKQCPNCRTPIFKIAGCFAKDQRILMFDRSTKAAQEIQVGDELVGDDDEQKRTVLHVMTGVDDLFEVRQKNGATYTVNSQHTLVLIHKNGGNGGNLSELTVEDFLKLPADEQTEWRGLRSLGNKHYQITSLEVIPIGRGEFFGWSVDGNKRFLAPDGTVLRNCDQMWCTQCNVAFGWNSGRVETGVIHNPHYFEYLRQRGNGEVPRNPHEVRCGGLPPPNFLHNILGMMDNRSHRSCASYLTNVYRGVNHIRQVVMRGLPTAIDNVCNQDLRVDFLLKNCTEQEFKVKLQRREKDRNKQLEQRAILETYCNVVQDLLNELYHNGTTQVHGATFWSEEKAAVAIIEEQAIRQYTQQAWQKMNHKFGSHISCPL